MIRAATSKDIPECVRVIRESFSTVAEEFGFTPENAARFTAFATTDDRLNWHLLGEKRPMYVWEAAGRIAGYYSLLLSDDGSCELSNLCVLPAYRHRGIGEELLMHAFACAKTMRCSRMHIGIVEENTVLKSWYTSFGFIHTGVKKFDFFPFTCGYMTKELE
ncbi:MAG: GNAT family N-acetyltransferase [Clostridia bacterium]|nr:GNAT family N-acetyltransferase [Clostridia bacterium]